MRDGALTFTCAKNRKRKPVTLTIPVLPELQAIIDATPSKNLTFLTTERGNAFTNAFLGNCFRRRCDEAGLKQCSAHGLRKAGAYLAAEAGATEYQLMAIFGWATAKEAARYTKASRQKVLVAGAIDMLRRQSANEAVPLSEPVQKSGTNSAAK